MIGAWSRLLDDVSDLRVMVVARSVDPKVRAACGKGRRTIPLVLDPQGTLAEQLNARWTPRTYLFDEQGRLEYLQPDTTMTGMAPLEAREWLDRRASR